MRCWWTPRSGLFIVADGMGGHAAGEVASARATEVVKQHIAANRHLLKDLATNPSQDAARAAAALVEVAIQRACADIYRMALADAAKRGMGTTFVCLAVGGNKGVIGHVGDSRVYLVRDGQCHRLTEDHTLVAAQLKAGHHHQGAGGHLPVPQRDHPRGGHPGVRAGGHPDRRPVPGRHASSSARTACTATWTTRRSLPLVAGPQRGELPKRFVDLANERGGKDNITAVVVKVAGDGAMASAETAEAQSRMEALRKIPLFRHLTYKEQTAVLSIATTRTFPGGREIVVEGQPGEELFVVIRGRVAIEKNGVEIAELRPAATSARWASSTTPRARPRCAPPSPRAPW